MTVANHNGIILICDIVDGGLIRRKYIGHTEREAKRLFKKEIKEGK